MGFTEAYYEFFIGLTVNNNKTWFDAHRTEYEQEVKALFQHFVGSVLEKVTAIDGRFGSLQPKDCIFRINKDIRFSKDKSPYKLHCSAAVQLGGRKQMSAGGFYMEFGPDLCAIYSGVYLPEKEALRKIRERIAADPMGFERVIQEPGVVKAFGSGLGEKNKRIDADLMLASATQPLILNKQFYVRHVVEPEDTFGGDFDDYVVRIWEASRDYNAFIGGF